MYRNKTERNSSNSGSLCVVELWVVRCSWIFLNGFFVFHVLHPYKICIASIIGKRKEEKIRVTEGRIIFWSGFSAIFHTALLTPTSTPIPISLRGNSVPHLHPNLALLCKTPTLKKGGGFLLFWLGPPQHLHLGTWGAGKKGGVEREEGEGEEASFFFRGFASELKSQALGT